MPLLETRNLCKHFKAGTRCEVRALDDVSLSIEAGQFVLLTGPSGSGKTTLLALLGALERPTRGQVFFECRELGACFDVELARLRRRLGFIFQKYSLISGLPVWENVAYPLIPRGVGRRQRYEQAAKLLADLGLAEKIHARADELSGGEQQRVAVARALIGAPAVLLADEPTSNLDQAAAQALRTLLGDIHRQGTTVIVASHDALMAPLATATFELEAGKLKSGPRSSNHGSD